MALPRHTLMLRWLLALLFSLGPIALSPGEAAAEESLVRPGKRRPGGSGKVRRPPRPRRPGKARPARPRPPGKAPAGEGTVEDEAQRNQMLIERYLSVLESRPGEQFALNRLIELYRAEHGTLEGLLSRYEEQVADDERAFAPRMVLGELYRRGGRIEEAMGLFRQAAEIRPNDPAPHQALARVAQESDDGEAALAALEQALRLSRGNDRQEVLRQLRDLALAEDDLEAARGYQRDLVRATGNSLYVRLELGQALARDDRHHEAVEEFESVLRQVRGDPRARVPVLRELARSQSELGRSEEALSTLRTALRLTQPNTGERAELLEMMVDVYRRGDALRELVELLQEESIGGGFERAELLGRLLDELAESGPAERWYRTALRLNPRHVDTRERLIRLLIRQGRIEEATREYETLTRTAPGEPRFVTELAEMYLRLGQRDRALSLLARTSRSHPNDVALHRALLNLYSHWGQEDLALEEARILTRIDPRDETHLVELGERYFQDGDHDRAMSTWRRIPTVTAERWRGLAVLGDVMADHEMSEEALDLYREALELRPDEISVIRRMANLLERLRRWDDAVERWERIIEVAPDQDVGARREARTRIVTIWANQRQLQRHLPELRARFNGTPPDVEAGRFLYEALERMGRLSDAIRVILRVIELRPGDVETLLALERGLVRQGDLAGAMGALQRLLELEPRRSREFFQRLASYAMQLQRDDEALDYAARALELNPDDAQGHYRLAQLYRQQGASGRAVTEYGRAIELNDRLYDAYLELAELHETRSEIQEAIRVYLRLLGKAPDDAMVRRAGRQALLLAEMAGTVDRLEHDLLPLALAQTERVVYRRLLVDLYGNLTWSLIQAAAHGEGEAAARARERLDAIGQRSLQPLLDALLDADPDQQEAAVSMLGHLGNASAAVPLMAYASGEISPSQRARALLAAGQVGDERIVSDLVEILDSPPSPGAPEAAAFGLARIATPEAIEALRRHLNSSVMVVRALACVGLGRSGEAQYIEPLFERFLTDPSDQVRRAAVWALSQLGDEDVALRLVRALASAPSEVRPAVAWALGALDERQARRELAAALFEEDQDIRQVAAWALRRAGAGRLRVESDDAYHRMPNGQLRITLYLDDLLRLVSGQGSALSALTRAGPEIETALEAALGGRGRPRNERIVIALRALESPEPGRILLSPLVRPEELDDEDVREAMSPLEQIALRRASALLEHSSPQVRGLAVSVLGQIGGEGAIESLIGALDDEDETVRNLALEQLGRLGNNLAVAPLAGLLDHDRWSVRIRVVRSLESISGDEAFQALSRSAREDPSPAVRAEACRALASIAETDTAARSLPETCDER